MPYWPFSSPNDKEKRKAEDVDVLATASDIEQSAVKRARRADNLSDLYPTIELEDSGSMATSGNAADRDDSRSTTSAATEPIVRDPVLLEARIKQLEGEASSLAMDKMDLESRNTALEAEKGELIGENNDLKAKKNRLQRDNTSLQADLVQRRSMIGTHENTISSNKAEISSLKTRLTVETDELAEVKADKSALKAKVELRDHKIMEISERAKNDQDRLHEMEQKIEELSRQAGLVQARKAKPGVPPSTEAAARKKGKLPEREVGDKSRLENVRAQTPKNSTNTESGPSTLLPVTLQSSKNNGKTPTKKDSKAGANSRGEGTTLFNRDGPIVFAEAPTPSRATSGAGPANHHTADAAEWDGLDVVIEASRHDK